jgi:2-polyprenyl-3-methyl-5-hydroxy-6-metoxy-1,4-benzoquinol methylase
MAGATDPLRTYLLNEENRAHYARADESLPADTAAYAGELLALRRQELAGWRSTWWRALPREPERILDAGCGPGFLSAALADELPRSAVLAADIEPEAIAVAETLAAERNNLLTRQSSLESLPPEVGSFDLIVCRTTLEHVFDPRVALGRLLDALAPNGALFLETPNYLFPYEPHLRLWMLPKSPKLLLRAECALFGRDSSFVDHLQLVCDPVTLRRWATNHGRYTVVDLMQQKVLDIARGRQDSAVQARRRATGLLRGVARRAPRLVELAAGLPVWPSAQLLITRES